MSLESVNSLPILPNEPSLGNPPTGSVLEYVKQAVIGGVCGVVGRVIDFPFDTIKTRLQTAPLQGIQSQLLKASTSGLSSLQRLPLIVDSPWTCLRQTIQQEGFRGLYRGCISPCLGAAFEDSIVFLVYTSTVQLIGKPFRTPDGAVHAPRPEGLTLPQIFFCGGMSGVATAFLLTPVELIKCRLQIDRVEVPQSGPASMKKASGAIAQAATTLAQPKYKGTIDCAVKSVQEEGIRVLYKGFSATLIREVFGTACWFATYEYCVRKLAPNVKNRDDVPSWTVLTAGAISGLVLNFVPYPFDTIKSIVQTLQDPAVPSNTSSPGSTSSSSSSPSSASASVSSKSGMTARSPNTAVAASAVYSAPPKTQHAFSTPMPGNSNTTGPTSTSRPAPAQPGFIQLTRIFVRTYGIRGLYSGLAPALIRAIPANAAIFFMYETLTRVLRDIH